MRIFHKIKLQNGETLIETLVSILVLTISAMLLATISLSAININRRTGEVDEQYRINMDIVEKMEAGTGGKIKVEKGSVSYSYDVDYYGEKDGLRSYKSQIGGINP